jgi:hypothetical protein
MKKLYPDASEDIPPNMPEPLGKPVQMNAFFDADQGGQSNKTFSKWNYHFSGTGSNYLVFQTTK